MITIQIIGIQVLNQQLTILLAVFTSRVVRFDLSIIVEYKALELWSLQNRYVAFIVHNISIECIL